LKNVENENNVRAVLRLVFEVGVRLSIMGSEVGRGVDHVLGNVGWGVRPGRVEIAGYQLLSIGMKKGRSLPSHPGPLNSTIITPSAPSK
jgi:hypothetical protein